MRRRKAPEIINLSEHELEGIKNRLESNTTEEQDKKIILLILSAYLWLQRQLRNKKLGIQRLRNLFGFKTEKRSKLKKNDEESDLDLNDTSDKTAPEQANQGGNVTPLKKPQNKTQKKIMVE